MEHLSPEWIAAFDEIVRDNADLRRATADRHVVVELGVDDVAYALVLDHGDNRVVAGAHPDPDITLRTDRATAAAIASHGESAQSAFMAGRLRLGGDVRILIANQDVLADVDDCAAGLRERTQFGAVPDGAAGA